MPDAEAILLARAGRAYEHGRVRLGVRTASVVAPMALVSWIACGKPAATLVGSGLLVVFVTLAVWRGQDAARGARLGLVAGVLPLVLPIAVAATGHVCNASVCLLFPTTCLVGGVAGGVAMGLLARRAGLGALGTASAALVAWLTGSLGCLVAGFAGVGVLVAGLAFGLAPALTLRRA